VCIVFWVACGSAWHGNGGSQKREVEVAPVPPEPLTFELASAQGLRLSAEVKSNLNLDAFVHNADTTELAGKSADEV
jgi:hypothetical protein